jgi:ribA/ribD-fused uncharacterized protein
MFRFVISQAIVIFSDCDKNVEEMSFHSKTKMEELDWVGVVGGMQHRILGFVSHKKAKEEHTYTFSNFARHDGVTHVYEVLPACNKASRSEFEGTVQCSCSEEMIMLAKAALFGDVAVWERICTNAATNAHPMLTKKLGRSIRDFDDAVWKSVLLSIAADVIVTKMTQDRVARGQLLRTGNRVLAETNPDDAIWGIALEYEDVDVEFAERWKGRNVLGWALMSCRNVMARREELLGELLRNNPRV